MKQAFKINQGNSYKIGVNEVIGLKQAMHDAMTPIQSKLKESIYWSEIALSESEYKSRDGFIPHSDNCGGVEISEIIPECEQYNFNILNFGEQCGGLDCCKDNEEYERVGCQCDNEGHLSAKLRIWLKFEGIEDDTLKFYLVVTGGNGDAPYFREKYSRTIFETEFTCKSIAGFKRESKKHTNKVLELFK